MTVIIRKPLNIARNFSPAVRGIIIDAVLYGANLDDQPEQVKEDCLALCEALPVAIRESGKVDSLELRIDILNQLFDDLQKRYRKPSTSYRKFR
jgi:hypothetical protein